MLQAVGDFEYHQLEESQYLMGPMMFWGYILLVYFILVRQWTINLSLPLLVV